MIKLLTRADLIVSSFFINLLGLALPFTLYSRLRVTYQMVLTKRFMP